VPGDIGKTGEVDGMSNCSKVAEKRVFGEHGREE
jgi:hypothetical protein